MFVPSLSWQFFRFLNGSKMPFSRTLHRDAVRGWDPLGRIA
jgi:hypothetical protein